MPQRYKMTIAYDGTAYAGWQIQPRNVAVQEVVQNAIRSVTGEAVVVHASGRTDHGVHARGQVVHADFERPRDLTATLTRGMNAVLPPDIRVLDARPVADWFHARRSVLSKEYRYFIWNDEVVPPFIRAYRTHVRGRLDAEAMAKAASSLAGRHDFAAFTANPNRFVESTVRNLTCLSVKRKGVEIVILARADGFLYKMVRSLAGFLIRVGEGAVHPEAAGRVLLSRVRTAGVPTAPPQGLFLWNVKYPRTGRQAEAKRLLPKVWAGD